MPDLCAPPSPSIHARGLGRHALGRPPRRGGERAVRRTACEITVRQWGCPSCRKLAQPVPHSAAASLPVSPDHQVCTHHELSRLGRRAGPSCESLWLACSRGLHQHIPHATRCPPSPSVRRGSAPRTHESGARARKFGHGLAVGRLRKAGLIASCKFCPSCALAERQAKSKPEAHGSIRVLRLGERQGVPVVSPMSRPPGLKTCALRRDGGMLTRWPRTRAVGGQPSRNTASHGQSSCPPCRGQRVLVPFQPLATKPPSPGWRSALVGALELSFVSPPPAAKAPDFEPGAACEAMGTGCRPHVPGSRPEHSEEPAAGLDQRQSEFLFD